MISQTISSLIPEQVGRWNLVCNNCGKSEDITGEDGEFSDSLLGELEECCKWRTGLQVKNSDESLDLCPNCWPKQLDSFWETIDFN